MKNVKAPVNLKLVFCLCWLIVLAMIKNSVAGEYFIFQDPKGNLVISNNAPPAGSKIIKSETLPEVSDQQIAESRARDDRVGLDNRLANVEKSIGELSENLRAQSEVIGNLQQSDSDHNIAVGVTQAPAIVARPPRGHLRGPNAQPRGTVPTSPRHSRRAG